MAAVNPLAEENCDGGYKTGLHHRRIDPARIATDVDYQPDSLARIPGASPAVQALVARLLSGQQVDTRHSTYAEAMRLPGTFAAVRQSLREGHLIQTAPRILNAMARLACNDAAPAAGRVAAARIVLEVAGVIGQPAHEPGRAPAEDLPTAVGSRKAEEHIAAMQAQLAHLRRALVETQPIDVTPQAPDSRDPLAGL